MSTLKTISFRMRADAIETLDALAERMDRDRTYLLNEAVERYLELNEYHIKLIEKGFCAAEAGDFVPEAEMKKLIARMRRAK
jgi:predicted transcriptional regulator